MPPPPPKVYACTDKNLDFLGLEKVWERPLKNSESPVVKDSYLLGDYLIIETKGRKLYGLNRFSGFPEFLAELNDPLDVRACQDERYVYVVGRDVLIGIDKRGIPTIRETLDFAPSSQLVADETNIYAGCYDGRIRAYRKVSDVKYVDWTASTDRGVSSRPAIGSKLIYGASQDGTVYALSPANGEVAWKFPTEGAIHGDVAYVNRVVYVASSDGSVYALHDLAQLSPQAQQAWPMPYASGAAIMTSPMVLGDSVYVVNEKRECHAIDAATGAGKWVVKDISKILSRGELNTYLLRGTNEILAVDSQDGQIRWVLDVSNQNISRFPANPTDDSLYLMRRDGSTILIRERKPAMMPDKAVDDNKDRDN